MTALAQSKNYAQYCKAMAAKGFEPLPKIMWRAIKENKPDLVKRAPLNLPATT